MKTIDQWLSAYSESHQNHMNVVIHKVAVPLIVMSVFGLLWCLPVPEGLRFVPWLNWAVIVGIAAVIFYLSLSLTLALGMAVWVTLQAFLFSWVEQRIFMPLWLLSVAIFIVAWITQFVGHAIEGKRPSFANDLIFLLIGPLWVLVPLYKKLGIKLALKAKG